MWVIFSAALYFVIVVMGTVYSLPEYGRLVRMVAERGEGDPEAHARLVRAAWVNRAELFLVFVALFGIVIGSVA